MKIFLSYNRDELLNGDEIQQNNITELILRKIQEDSFNQYYFDSLKNEGFTDVQIFINIQKFLDNEDSAYLFIGDSLICYGWAERELRYALIKKREIRKIKLKTFLKMINKKNIDLCKIYAKAKRIKSAI